MQFSQFLHSVMIGLDATLLALLISSILCYLAFGQRFFDIVKHLLNCDDDDNDGPGGGKLQPVTVSVRF
ncbi:MAG: hypothetical protein Q8T09_11265 [Candidatus Melainabacteria bacterium]|nr:hypothetical protein [Candidatus Melainabacteria bacterium]